mmetsp:Transcript_1880/g.2829  ORF Transcript_1880/g.2829 Transcript_1880/m.2829 type:complete len:122 (-) Transcript_1880:539-904(-)
MHVNRAMDGCVSAEGCWPAMTLDETEFLIELADEILRDLARFCRPRLILLLIRIYLGHVHRVVVETLLLKIEAAGIPCQVTSHTAWVSPELLEQLIGLHQIYEALEALALLVNFLVLAPVE